MSLTRITKRLLNLFTAKGDLLTYNGTAHVAFPAPVTDNLRLTSDSTQPDGLKWSTILAAKGSLLVGDGTVNDNHLNVGTDGQVIVADSSQTVGLRWTNPGSLSGLALFNGLGTNATSDSIGVSSSALNNFTQSAAVIGYTFGVGELQAGNTYRLTLTGVWHTGATETFTVKMFFGNQSVLLATLGLSSGIVSGNDVGFELILMLRVITTGVSGTVRSNMWGLNGAVLAATNGGTSNNDSKSVTVNTTATQQLTVAGQFNTNVSGQHAELHQYTLERLT